MPNEAIENALIAEVRKHKNGIGAQALRLILEKQGYEAAEVQAALRHFLDKGLLHLGAGLKFELEAA